MTEQKREPRHWRIVAQELATEKDPSKIPLLLEELSRAIRFVRYEESEDTSFDD